MNLAWRNRAGDYGRRRAPQHGNGSSVQSPVVPCLAEAGIIGYLCTPTGTLSVLGWREPRQFTDSRPLRHIRVGSYLITLPLWSDLPTGPHHLIDVGDRAETKVHQPRAEEASPENSSRRRSTTFPGGLRALGDSRLRFQINSSAMATSSIVGGTLR